MRVLIVTGDAVDVATKIMPGVSTGFAGGNRAGGVLLSDGTNNISQALCVGNPLVQPKTALVVVIVPTVNADGRMHVGKVVKFSPADHGDGSGEQTTLT